MAKTDEIKFIDQHLEKVVLGVCALIMAYGVFHWVLSRPQRSEVPEVDGQVVPTSRVDNSIFQWAERVSMRKPSKQPPKKVDDYAGEIARLRAPAGGDVVESWGDQRMVMVSPIRVEPPGGVPLKKVTDILEAIAPKFVELKGSRELTSDQDGVDKLVFRGKAEFPRDELLKAWNKVFRGSAMDEVTNTILAVEIEKRIVLAPGVFGPATQVQSAEIPPAEGAPVVKLIVLPEFDGKNGPDVRKAILDFSATEAKMLRPPYWQVWSVEEKGWNRPWLKLPPAPAAPAPDPAKAPAPAPVAAVDDGITDILFHDTDVAVQRRYSYRMRLVFVSPLYTYTEVVPKEKPDDAKVVKIYSAWSPWVEAKPIPRTTQYFATGAQLLGSKQDMYCTVFSRSLGQVVSHRFRAPPGRIIGGMESKRIKNPATGTFVHKTVDFSTNAIVVHADFAKNFVGKSGRSGKTKELICLEGDKLVSQIIVTDMPDTDPRSQAYRELQAAVDGATP